MAFRRIALGTAAMSSVSVLRLLAQFFVVPVLSRLLSPADYGVVAMAMPFVIFVMNFTDVGVGQSLVRTAPKEREVWSTSFWLTILSGSALTILVIGLAPLGALFFHEPRLQPIIMALAFVIIPQAGATIPEASLRQSLRFGTIATVEIISVLTGIALAVVIALKGGGAWALVGQQLGLYGLRFLMTLTLSSFRPQFCFRLHLITDHLAFGRDLLVTKLVWFLTQAMDGIIVGRVLGASILGFYTMASMFLRLPVQVITGPLQYVIYAHIAPLRNHIPVLRQIFLFFTRLLAIVIFPSMGLVAAAYHPVFKIFLSEKWLSSGDLFMLATPAMALQSVTAMRGTLMMVLGRMKTQLQSSLEFFVLLAATLLFSIQFGIYWFIIGYTAAVLLYFPRSLALILPAIECSLRTYVYAFIVPIFVTILFIMIYLGLNHAVVMGDWLQLFLGGALSVAAMAVSVFLQRRPLTREAALLRAHWQKEGQA